MNIGAAEQASGLPAKTIRYYEDIGLLIPARQDNGYRDYGLPDVHKLAFLKRARGLGFTIEECRALMSLYEDRNRASADVKALARTHLQGIEAKIAELRGLRDVLSHLIDACHGDARPDCPILDDLSGTPGGHH
jgi:MerR family transcriptional regulator, copper efflux regulator